MSTPFHATRAERAGLFKVRELVLPRWPRDEGTLASYVQVKLVVEKCTKLTVIFIPPEAKCRVHYLAIVANFARTGVAVRSPEVRP